MRKYKDDVYICNVIIRAAFGSFFVHKNISKWYGFLVVSVSVIAELLFNSRQFQFVLLSAKSSD